MDARLFESFKRRGLGARETGFGAALGERPAAVAGPDQKKFKAILPCLEADGCNLVYRIERWGAKSLLR